MKKTFFASRDEIIIVFIHKNIPYLLPSSALTLSGFGPPDHESLLVLFWCHTKSAIEHFYIKIKRGFPPCLHGLHGGWRYETGLSPPVKYFYWPFQGGTSFVDHLCYFCLVFVMLSRVCLLMPCDHLGWPLGSRLWCLFVWLSLTHVVSWVRCGTWLYRFLMFAPFLTFPSWCSFLYGLLIL